MKSVCHAETDLLLDTVEPIPVVAEPFSDMAVASVPGVVKPASGMLELAFDMGVEPFPSTVTAVCGVLVAAVPVPIPSVLVEVVSSSRVKSAADSEVELLSVMFVVLVSARR